MYIDANNLYGWAMSEYLPYDEIYFDKNVKLEAVLNIPDDREIGYFIVVDLKFPDNRKYYTKILPYTPENKKKINPDNFTDQMKKIIPGTCTQTKKLICDWYDKKKYLIHYRLLNFLC